MLGSLAIVCAVAAACSRALPDYSAGSSRGVLVAGARGRAGRLHRRRRRGRHPRPAGSRPPRRSRTRAQLPQIAILPSKGVADACSTGRPARRIAGDLVADLGLAGGRAVAARPEASCARAAAGDELTQLHEAGARGHGTARSRSPRRASSACASISRPGTARAPAIAVVTRRRHAAARRPTRTCRRCWCAATPPSRSSETLELQADRGRWLVAHVRSGRPVAVVAAPHRERGAAQRGRGRLRRGAPHRRREEGRARLPAGRLPLRRLHATPPAMMGGGALLARLRQRRLARPLRRQQLRGRRHRRVGQARRPAAERALPQRPRALRERHEAGRAPACRCAARAASPPTSTATATPTSSSARPPDDKLLWNNGDGTFTRGRALLGRRLVRLALRRDRRRRERRRAPRPLRRRLHRGERADPRLDDRLPDQPPGRARPALPERGQRPERARALPGGRAAGRHRPGAVRPLARRRLHRPERRRAARPVRRERRGSEPLLRQRGGAGHGSASASSTAPTATGLADHERRHGHRRGRLQRRRPRRPGRDQLARPGPRGLPRASGAVVRATAQAAFATAFGTNFTGWGASWVDLEQRRRTSTSCSRTARSRSRTWLGTPGPSRCSRTSTAGSRARRRSSASTAQPRMNGRGVAAADFDNDGDLDVAVNSVGGKLVLLRGHGRARATGSRSSLPRFAPGAVVTAVAARRTQARPGGARRARATSRPRIRASTSGSATPTKVATLSVRYPGGRDDDPARRRRPTGS